MNRFWGRVLFVSFQLLLAFNSYASMRTIWESSAQNQPMSRCQETSNQNSIAQQYSYIGSAGEWFRGQQNEETGLLRSYNMPGDYMAWTYDQAAGVIALLSVGDVNTAKKCIDGMMAIRREPNHVWVDGYDSVSGEEVAKSIATGPNAWMGLALLKLYQVVGNGEYLLAAEDIAEFILELQAKDCCSAGSIPGGYGDNNRWTSTEHNADAMAFLVSLAQVSDANAQVYRNAAVRIAEWLDREMWDPNLGCYYTGYSDNNTCAISDFPERLDSQTWTLLAFQVMTSCNGNYPEITGLIHNGLPWIDQYSCQVDYNDCNLVGFAKVTLGFRATESFWSEGTAGYILAAGAACHSKTNQNTMLNSLHCLQGPNGSIPYSVGIPCTEIHQYFDPCDIILAHFESHPHCLYGQLGVYGDGAPDWGKIEDANFEEPYSWYYEPEKPGYDANNIHTCWQSFRLVNATDMCLSQDQGWASFGMDLGPEINGVIKARDVSAYEEFVFWAKTDNNDVANIEVLFRDANWGSYLPQVNIPPVPPVINNTWNEYIVELDDIKGVNGLNLSKLVHIGLAFGTNVGNNPGTIIYIDDMGFTGSDTNTPLSNGGNMPAIFPQHWPYENVAATAWFIFVELDTNPFAANCEGPLKPCLVPRGDLDSDCWVDFNDLALFVRQWQLPRLSADIAPQIRDHSVDFFDWAVFADTWWSTPSSQNWDPNCDIFPDEGDDKINWYDVAVFTEQWLFYYYADIAPDGGDGIVDFRDFAALAENWLRQLE